MQSLQTYTLFRNAKPALWICRKGLVQNGLKKITVWTKITLQENCQNTWDQKYFRFQKQHFVKVKNSESSILSFKKSKPWNT